MEEAGQYYDDCWVHDVESIDGVEYDIEVRENYLRCRYYARGPRFWAEYKEYLFSVRQTRVGLTLSVRYSVGHSLANYLRQDFKSPEDAINKMVELVDSKLEQRN